MQLSYFGTDQSQVGRYLTGSSVRESRMGLLMNGVLKIPMQFCILLIGVLVFAYYQYNTPPLFFNQAEAKKLENSSYSAQYQSLITQHEQTKAAKAADVEGLIKAMKANDKRAEEDFTAALATHNQSTDSLRAQMINLLQQNDAAADTNDNNYVFLSFVSDVFPKGLVGLLIAIIFLASMGATASAINSLSSTTVIDIIKRFVRKTGDDKTYLRISRFTTLFWGIFTVIIALYANRVGNLLEAVNILGSLFYGTILGIFLVAFYLQKIGGKAVFIAALLTEALIIYIWQQDVIAFLWLNLIGCIGVIVIGYIIQLFLPAHKSIAQ